MNKNSKGIRRFVAWGLTLALVFAMVPAGAAFAENDPAQGDAPITTPDGDHPSDEGPTLDPDPSLRGAEGDEAIQPTPDDDPTSDEGGSLGDTGSLAAPTDCDLGLLTDGDTAPD